ncbi:MAG: DUF5018 domain-containing protein [Clostridium sp.]|nr:DUF5018 domain-containing protein [Clostridium sp.]
MIWTNNDCYISNFKLGTIRRILHTTSSTGEDSTYVASYSGAYYSMNIDQAALTIMNNDSLPKESDVSRVLVTISGEGDVFYREADNPGASWYPYSSADSIDFSKPQTFLVISSDGTASKEYTVKINVHQQEGNEFSWNKMGDTDVLEPLTDIRLFVWNNRLYVIGRDGQQVYLAETGLQDGRNWVRKQTEGCERAITQSLCVLDDRLFLSTEDGEVLSSADGEHWTVCGTGVDRLFVADGTFLYAVASGTICRSVDGQTWEPEELDEEASWLPTRDVAGAYFTQRNGNGRVMLVGNRDRDMFAADTAAVVWGKTIVPAVPDSRSWIYYVMAPDNIYACPQLANLTLLHYTDVLIALGEASLDGITHEPLDAFYVSSDNGITWQKDAVLTPPSSLKGIAGSVSAVVDDEQFIWLVCGRQVWKGRLNSLGFEQK